MSFIRNLRNLIEAFSGPPSDPDVDLFALPEIQPSGYAPSYRIPPPPEPSELLRQSRDAWVPPGQTVTIAGRVIPGGAIYVGKRLPPISGWEQVDPALIDPTLPVDGPPPQTPNYHWMPSSYSRLDLTVRAGYLDWLASGKPAGAHTSFAYMVLYGLERRILFDARLDKTARGELPALIAMIHELDRTFGDDRYFKPCLTQLLVTSNLLHGIPELSHIEPAVVANTWELPMPLLIGLDTFARKREPVPAEWAFSWICSDPDTSLRTAATRLWDDFRTLFKLRYDEQFGVGMVLTPPKPRLDVHISPSSPSFAHALTIPDPDLPDLSRVRKPQKQLRQIVEAVTTELDNYSRTIGLSGDRYAPLALAARPWELGSIAGAPSLAPLSKVLAEAIGTRPMGLVEVQQLTGAIPGLSQPPTQKQSASISRLTHRLGYGLEPDPGQMRKAFIDSARVGIYRRDDGAPLSDRSMQQMALSLCALIIGVDGTLDMPTQNDLLNLIATRYPISIEDTYRLAAFVSWLADHPISFAAVKRQWNQLEIDFDASLLTVLIQAAARDGEISGAEMRMLFKLYPLFGRTEQQLHSDLHQHFAGASGAIPAGSQPNRTATNATADGHIIDTHRVRQVQRQTDEIQAVLGALFTNDPIERDIALMRPVDAVASVDSYTQLTAALQNRSSVTITELSALAADLGLMTSGAIETINDRAIALGLEPLLDCDGENCDCYEPTLQELLAHV